MISSFISKIINPSKTIQLIVFILSLTLPLDPINADKKSTQLIEIAHYLKIVHDKIQKNWQVKSIPLMELHRRYAIFTLWFSPKGKILKIKLSSSSGYDRFDKTLLQSIKKITRYPKPPQSIQQYLKKNGLQISFRRRVFKKKLLPLKRKYDSTVRVPNWRPTPIKRKKN